MNKSLLLLLLAFCSVSLADPAPPLPLPKILREDTATVSLQGTSVLSTVGGANPVATPNPDSAESTVGQETRTEFPHANAQGYRLWAQATEPTAQHIFVESSEHAFDYLRAGLKPALAAAGLLALLFMLITAHRAAYNLREFDELVVLCALGVSAFTSLACVFYPLANLLRLGMDQVDFSTGWKLLNKNLPEELKNGVLALRVTSVAVGLTATRSLFEALRLDPLPTTKEATQRLFRYREADQVDAQGLTVHRNRFAQTALNLVQTGFYELNILLLWNIRFAGETTTAAALLAWALFYIIDDWRIIFRLSLALKGRFLREHYRQVRNTNWVITLAGAWCAYQWDWLALIAYVGCSVLLHRMLLYVAQGVRGNWKIPGALDWKFFDQKMDHVTGERKG